MRLALTLAPLLVGLFVVAGACASKTEPCCGSCPAPLPAIFRLTCDAAILQSMVATGPCETADGDPSSIQDNGDIVLRSDSAGVCHVDLTISTGFRFATDVTFATRSGGVCGGPQCACPDIVAPTSSPIAVCVDGGIGEQ